jgi:hypothetical protein
VNGPIPFDYRIRIKYKNNGDNKIITIITVSGEVDWTDMAPGRWVLVNMVTNARIR